MGRVEQRTLLRLPIEWHLGHWYGCKQVCKIKRVRWINGRESEEVVYAITSLSLEATSPRELLKLNRDHWQIENNLHGVRDGEFREDQCTLRRGASPQVWASMRNTVITQLKRKGKSIKIQRESYAHRPNLSIKDLREN